MRSAPTLTFGLLATVALLGAGATGAVAAPAVEEYVLDIPGGGNGGGTPSGEGTESGPGTSTLPPGAEASLAGHGPDGVAAAQLAKRSGSGGASDGDGKDAGGAPSDPAAAGLDGTGNSALSEIIATTSGDSDSGMGWVLPALLLLALAGGLGFAVARRRAAAR